MRDSAVCRSWAMSAPPRGAWFGATPFLRRTTSSAEATRSSTRTRPTGAISASGLATIVDIDDVHGTIDLKRGPSMLGYHPTSLIPTKPIGAGPMPSALLRIADHVIANGIEGDGPFRAARDLLTRRPPRIGGVEAGTPLVGSDEDIIEGARRIAAGLDDTVLPIQGPPGTGKTYTGARMIVELIRRGRRVGVAAQSHKAITNMLEAVSEAAVDAGVPLRAVQKCDTGDELRNDPGVRLAADNEEVETGIRDGRFDLAAGTQWLFARPEMLEAVDVLFVDEAGQMSLANVIAMSGAARSVVLLGDPEPAAPGQSRRAPRGRRRVSPRASARRRRHPRRSSWRLPSHHVADAPGGQHLHLGDLLRRSARDPPVDESAAHRRRTNRCSMAPASGTSASSTTEMGRARAKRPELSRMPSPPCSGSRGRTDTATREPSESRT